MTLSVVSVAVEVSKIVPAVLTVLVSVPETVLAVRFIVLSVSVGRDDMPELVRVPVTLLVKVRRQVWRLHCAWCRWRTRYLRSYQSRRWCLSRCQTQTWPVD